MSTVPCVSCKKRRVRCDASLPTCTRCPRDGIECLGYKSPIVWIYHDQSSKGLRRSRHRPNESSPRLTLQSSRANVNQTRDQLVPHRTNSLRKTSGWHPLQNTAWLPSDELALSTLNFVQYYNERIAPYIIADGVVLPWTRIQLDEWRDRPDVIKKSLDMFCAQHKAIVSQENLDDDLEVCKQRYHAIQTLNQQLIHSAHDSALLLEAVVMLLTGDIQYSATGAWHQHTQGAAAIVELQGGWDEYIGSSSDAPHITSHFITVEIIGGTTSNARHLKKSPKWPYDLIQSFPNWDRITVASCCPCPKALFEVIAQTNFLRASLCNDGSGSIQTTAEETSQSIRSVLAGIANFSPQSWLADLTRTIHFQLSSPDWLALISCYHAATLLYCLRTLVLETSFGDPEILSSVLKDTFGTTVAETVRVGALRALFHHLGCPLHSLGAAGLKADSVAWNVVVWPLFIAGFEAGGEYLTSAEAREMKAFVSDKLRHVTMLLGSRSVSDAQRLLEECWASRDIGGNIGLDGGPTWDESFPDRFVFISSF